MSQPVSEQEDIHFKKSNDDIEDVKLDDIEIKENSQQQQQQNQGQGSDRGDYHHEDDNEEEQKEHSQLIIKNKGQDSSSELSGFERSVDIPYENHGENQLGPSQNITKCTFQPNHFIGFPQTSPSRVPDGKKIHIDQNINFIQPNKGEQDDSFKEDDEEENDEGDYEKKKSFDKDLQEYQITDIKGNVHKFKVNEEEGGLDYYLNNKKKNVVLYEIDFNPSKFSFQGWDEDVVFEETLDEETYNTAKDKLENLCELAGAYFDEFDEEADFPEDSDTEYQQNDKQKNSDLEDDDSYGFDDSYNDYDDEDLDDEELDALVNDIEAENDDLKSKKSDIQLKQQEDNLDQSNKQLINGQKDHSQDSKDLQDELKDRVDSQLPSNQTQIKAKIQVDSVRQLQSGENLVKQDEEEEDDSDSDESDLDQDNQNDQQQELQDFLTDEDEFNFDKQDDEKQNLIGKRSDQKKNSQKIEQLKGSQQQIQKDQVIEEQVVVQEGQKQQQQPVKAGQKDDEELQGEKIKEQNQQQNIEMQDLKEQENSKDRSNSFGSQQEEDYEDDDEDLYKEQQSEEQKKFAQAIQNKMQKIQEQHVLVVEEEKQLLVKTKKKKRNWIKSKIPILQNSSSESSSSDDEKQDKKKMKKQKQMLKQQEKGEKKFDKLCFLRSLFRTIVHFTLISACLLFFLIVYLESYDEGEKSYSIKEGYTFDFKLANCLVDIEQHDDDQMKVEYFIHYSVTPFNGDKGDQTEFKLNNKGSDNKFEFVAESVFSDKKYCFLHIYLPQDIDNYQDFNVQCKEDSECVIVYKGAMKTYNNMDFEANGDESVLALNFEQLSYSKFTLNTQNRGLIFLQNVLLKDNSQTQIDIDFGEVIIQSIQDYELQFFNPFQSICYNAPYIYQDGALKCDIIDSIGTYNPSTPTPVTVSEGIQSNDGENKTKQQRFQTPLDATRLKGCEGKVKLCKIQSECQTKSMAFFNVTVQKTGNIYANQIQEQGVPPNYDLDQGKFNTNPFNLLKGAVYKNGLQYNDNIMNDVNEFEEKSETQTEPIWIIDLGNKFLQSSTQSLWVKSTNPSFALMRPWWLATWSFSLLVTQTYELEGYLQPGFCPYSTSLTIDQYWQIKQFVFSSLEQKEEGIKDRSSVTYIRQEDEKDPNTKHKKDVGVQPFNKDERVTEEDWMNIKEQKGQKIPYKYDSSEEPLIMVSIIISMLVSLILVFIFLYAFVKVLPIFIKQLSEISGQFEKYTTTIAAKNQEEAKKQNEEFFDQSDDVAIPMKNQKKKKKMHQPSFVATIDFFNFIQTRKASKSYETFFSLLFKRADQETESKLMDGDRDFEQHKQIKERQLKQLFEKFCYLNHLTEIRLSDENVVNLLNKTYGYTFITDQSPSPQFKKITEKKQKDILISDPSFIKKGNNSLEKFIEIHYEVTGRDIDDVWVEDMQEKYNIFCSNYRLKQSEFRTEQIAKQYKLDLVNRPQMVLVMKKSNKSQQEIEEKEQKKIKNYNKDQKKKKEEKDKKKSSGKYLIQTNQLQLHVSLMSDPGTYTDQHLKNLTFGKILKNEFYDIMKVFTFFYRPFIPFSLEEEAFLDTIYGGMWIMTDLRIVLSHFFLNVILIAPLFLFIIINQVFYAPYSLSHPSNLMSESDFSYSLVFFPLYVDNCSTTMLIGLIVIFLFIFVQGANEFFIFWGAKFPADRAFEREKKRGQNIYSRFQFFVMLILLAFAIFYISMNLLWLILGAIINPNYFLVYTTSVLTLVTFVTAKKKQFDDLHEGGIDMIKDLLLKEYTKKVQGIMGMIEAQKSAVLSKVDQAKEMAISTADMVGLGDEAESMISDVESNFQSVDKIQPSDLDPQKIAQKAEEMKKQMKEKAFEQITKQLTTYGLSKELGQGIYMLVVENDTKQSSAIIADEIEKQSDQKLPASLIRWILDSVKNQKGLNPKTMSKELQNSILEIILQTFMGDVDPNLKSQIRNLIFLIMKMINALQNSDLSEMIQIFKELMLLIPLQPGQDWTYSPTPSFILKFLQILQMIFSGESNSNEMGMIIQECLQMAQIPPEIGLFMTIIPSQKNAQKWKYQNLKIDSIDQLRIFVKDNIISQVVYQENESKEQFLSYVFSTTFKLLRGESDFEDEFKYGQKLLTKNFKKIMEKTIDKKLEGKDKKQEIDKKKKAVKQVIDIGSQIVKFIPLSFKNSEDIKQQIFSLFSETNMPARHIKGLIISSTKDIYIKLTGAKTRQEKLIQQNQFLADISESFGVENEIFLGIMELYHDQIQGEKEEIPHYYSHFQTFIIKTLGIKSEKHKILIKTLFKVFKIRSLWNLNNILQEFFDLEEIQQLIKDLDKRESDYRYKIYLEFTDFIHNGDTRQLSQLISKSYAMLQKDYVIEFFTKYLFNDKYVQNKLKSQFEKLKQAQDQSKNFNARKSALQTLKKSTNTNDKNAKNENQDKQVNNLQNFLDQELKKHVDQIEYIFSQRARKGHIPLVQIPRKHLRQKSIQELAINIFSAFGIPKSAFKLLWNLFKVCYLKVNPSGFDRNDRIRIVSDCASELKLTNQAMNQILSFLDISHSSSKETITEFYVQNPQIFQSNQDASQQNTKKKLSEESIRKTCQTVLEYVEQMDKINQNIFNFIYDEPQQQQPQQQTQQIQEQQQQKPQKDKKQKSKGMGFFDIAKKFISKDQFFKAIFGTQKLSQLSSNISKDQILQVLNGILDYLVQQNIVQQDDVQKLLPIIFELFYINENLSLDSVLRFVDLEANLLSKEQRKNINTLLKLFKLNLNESNIGLLSELKKFILDIMVNNKQDRNNIEFVLDLIATLSTTEEQRKYYHPGDYAKKFFQTFNFIEYRFTQDPEKFVQFAEHICKSLFKFDSISTKVLNIIFSLLGDYPRIDEAAQLLSIDNSIVEIAYGISKLIQGKDISNMIEKFTSQVGFKRMCSKGQMVPKEVQLLLKLSLKAFKLEDLDSFFDIFGMKKQIDIEVLKGFFAFMLPVSEYVKDAKQQDLELQYIRNFNSRQYLYNEMSSKDNRYVSSVILPSNEYEAIEFYYNMNRGRYYNIMYQLQSQQTMKQMKIFGGQNFIRQSMLGLIGYLQIPANNYTLKPSGLEQQFSKYRKGQVGISNNFEGAVFLITEAALKDVSVEALKAFIEPQMSPKEYQKKKKMENEKISANDKQKMALFELSHKLTYSDKIKLIETEFLRSKLNSFDSVLEKKYYNTDENTYYELSDKLYYITEELNQNKCANDSENYYQNMEEEKQTLLDEMYYLASEFSYRPLQYILMSTLQDMKKSSQEQKEILNKEKKPDNKLRYLEMYFIKYILDLDLVLNCVGKLYLQSTDAKQTEFFRKNYILEVMTLINQPLTLYLLKETKKKTDLFKMVFNKILPSNPSCYLQQYNNLQSNEFEIFQKMFYQSTGSQNEDEHHEEDNDKKDKKEKKKQDDKFLEDVKILSEKYQKVYLNEGRFEIVDDLEKLYKQCKSSLSGKDDKKKGGKKNAKVLDAISGYAKKVQSKNVYKNYKKDVLEKRKIYYKIEEENKEEDLENNQDDPAQRQSQIKNKMSQEEKTRVEFLRILKHNVDSYIQDFLSNSKGIKGTIDLVFQKSPGVLGSASTKDLIVNILKIQDSPQRNYSLVEKVLQQLQNMQSNSSSLENLLQTLCQPDKDVNALNNFCQLFIDPKFTQAFQGILYLQLLKSDSYNLKKVATMQVMQEFEEDEFFKQLSKNQQIELVQKESYIKMQAMLNSALNNLISKKILKISKEQNRLVILLLQCFVGISDAWLLLFTEKLKIFENAPPLLSQLGQKFLLQFFSYLEGLKKMSGVDHPIHNIKNKNIQQIIKEMASNNTITDKFDFFQQFFMDPDNLPIQNLQKEHHTIIKNIISSYCTPNKNIYTDDFIQSIFDQDNGLIKNIPKEISELISTLSSWTLKSFLNNPSSDLATYAEELLPLIEKLSEPYIKKHLSQQQQELFKSIFEIVVSSLSNDPLITVNMQLFKMLNSMEKKEDKKGKYQDQKILIAGALSANCLTNVHTLNQSKVKMMLYFFCQVFEKFAKKYHKDVKDIPIVKFIVDHVEGLEDYDYEYLISDLQSKERVFKSVVKDKSKIYSFFKEQMEKIAEEFVEEVPQAAEDIDNLLKDKDLEVDLDADLDLDLDGIDVKDIQLDDDQENDQENDGEEEVDSYGGVKKKKKEGKKKSKFSQLEELIKPLMDMFEGSFKVIDHYDYELNGIMDFFKIMYYYFSGAVSTEKGSHAWNMVKDQRHQTAFEVLSDIINTDDDFSAMGLRLIGDSLIIGFDVLKNKEKHSTREFLMKYDFLIGEYLGNLKDIIGNIVEDYDFMKLVEIIINFFLNIFVEDDSKSDPEENIIHSLLESVEPIFNFILKKTFSNTKKDMEFFNNNQQKYEEFKNLQLEIQKKNDMINSEQAKLKKAKQDLGIIKKQVSLLDRETQELEYQNNKDEQQRQLLDKKYEDLDEKYEEQYKLEDQIRTLVESMKTEKKDIREIEDQILKSDENMYRIKENVVNIIEKIKEIQMVYKNDLEPIISNFIVNGFDEKIFVNKFIPIVVQLVSSSFDKSSSIFIVNITNSLIALINGQFDQIHDDFFLILKLNPQDIQIVRSVLSMFSQNSTKPLQLLEQKKNDTLGFIAKKANNPAFNQLNKIKEKLDDQGLQPKDMFKLADLDDSHAIDMEEFRLFFKKLGIELSDHRVEEIFAYSKQGQAQETREQQNLEEEEFVKAYDYIQKYSLELTLEGIGITKALLTRILIGMILVLLLIFVFIFIGVQAFAIPGTFGAVVNSLFPIAGGGGVAKSDDQSAEKKLNPEKLKKVVQDSIATIQNYGV